jgi:nucleoside-diphosphate-sugar epimerase
MHVLIAGGAGYLGSALVPLLLDAGQRVTVVDRFFFGNDSLTESCARVNAPLSLVRADVRRLTRSALEGVDAVVYLAGISNDPACELDPRLTREVNLEAGLRLSSMAQELGIRRFVFASSCSVYGHAASERLTEQSPLNPVSLYARCKAEAEVELLAQRSGLEPTILRFATLFGVAGRPRFDLAINVMTKNAYTRREILVDGGGRQWRPFVHVRDAARAIREVLGAESRLVAHQVFNVGADQNNVRILNLAYRIRDQVPGTQVRIAPTDPDLRDYNVGFEKLKSTLDFTAKISIDDGIREILEALRLGRIDPNDRHGYTLEHYGFLAEVERTFERLSLDGKVLGLGGSAG